MLIYHSTDKRERPQTTGNFFLFVLSFTLILVLNINSLSNNPRTKINYQDYSNDITISTVLYVIDAYLNNPIINFAISSMLLLDLRKTLFGNKTKPRLELFSSVLQDEFPTLNISVPKNLSNTSLAQQSGNILQEEKVQFEKKLKEIQAELSQNPDLKFFANRVKLAVINSNGKIKFVIRIQSTTAMHRKIDILKKSLENRHTILSCKIEEAVKEDKSGKYTLYNFNIIII
jgi:hypothetical protein